MPRQQIRQSMYYTEEQWKCISEAAGRCATSPTAFVRMAALEKAEVINDGSLEKVRDELKNNLHPALKFFLFGPGR